MPQSRTLDRMRRVCALLAVASAVGGMVELAMLRHWNGIQVAPWVIFAVVTIAGIGAVAGRWRRFTQIAGGLGLFGAAAGLWHHIDTNHARGAEFLDTWDALSGAEQWWFAFNGTVGPAPALAPGLLGLAGALLLVAVMDRERTEQSPARRKS